MPFGGLQATNFGVRVQNKIPQGKKLHLTRVAIGDGVLGSAASSTFTTLLSERASFLISDVRSGTDDSIIIFILTNEGLAEGFYFREIGVFARDPDTNEEGLYLYDNCRAEGEYIDDGSDPRRRVKSYMRLHIKFAQTDQITITPGADPLFVTYGEFEEHVQENSARFTALETELSQQGHDISENAKAITALRTENAEQGTQLGQHGTKIVQLETDVADHERQLSILSGQIAGKASVTTYTVFLPASGWTGAGPYVQTVSVEGILATDNPVADVVLSENAADAIAETEAWAAVGRIVTMAGQIAVTCYEDKPARDITIQLKVVR